MHRSFFVVLFFGVFVMLLLCVFLYRPIQTALTQVRTDAARTILQRINEDYVAHAVYPWNTPDQATSARVNDAYRYDSDVDAVPDFLQRAPYARYFFRLRGIHVVLSRSAGEDEDPILCFSSRETTCVGR